MPTSYLSGGEKTQLAWTGILISSTRLGTQGKGVQTSGRLRTSLKLFDSGLPSVGSQSTSGAEEADQSQVRLETPSSSPTATQTTE